MRYIIVLFLPFILYATSSFITPMEYSSQLYKNPRGIGCQHCHGDIGEGRLVAKYKHKGKTKEFRGSAINSLNYDEFYDALKHSKKGMPRYYLTDKEIKALFFYLQNAKIENEK